MYHLVILAALSAPPNADAAVAAAWGFNERMSRVETEIVQLRNDVEAIKRDLTKCDISSKSPDPKPAAKCPDGVCADCKCTVGEDCGCKKTVGEKAIADVLAVKAVEHASEPEPIYLQQRSSYGNGGCPGGNCGVGAAGRVVKGFRLFRRR